MRNVLACLLACVLLLPGAAFAQAAGMEVDMDAGTIRIESPASVSIYSTLPLQDGTLLMAVSQGDALGGRSAAPADQTFPEAGRGLTLLRLSPGGEILWEQPLGEAEGSITLRLLCEAADGTVLTLLLHSIEQSEQYQQLRRYAIQDGSLAWSGDRLEPRAGINENVMHVDGGYLWEAVHDAGATTRPRYYDLYASDGTLRWQMDDARVGIPEQALAVPGGTLLLGSDEGGDVRFPRACAVLVDDAGQVVWRKDYPEPIGLSFLDAAVSPAGQVAVLAANTGMGGSGEHALYALDAGSGELRKLTTLSGMSNQYAKVAPYRGGWLIGYASGYEEADPPFARFIEIDAQGNTLGARDLSYEAGFLLPPSMFPWNGALWADLEIHLPEDSGQVSRLQRMD